MKFILWVLYCIAFGFFIGFGLWAWQQVAEHWANPWMAGKIEESRARKMVTAASPKGV